LIPSQTICEALNPLLSNTGGDEPSGARRVLTDGAVIDLSFLDELKRPDKEWFLTPRAIYVRDCMRLIFGLFREDIEKSPRRPRDMAYSTALIGSPGVGKSILFFLAALYQARMSKVVYYRKTKQESISVFFMTPSTDGNVRIWFTRNIQNDKLHSLGGLSSVSTALKDCWIVDDLDTYTFIDGPKYDEADTRDILGHNYDYFCTSGGMPLYSNHERIHKRRWVLDGWTKEESVEWLVTFLRRRHHRKIAVSGTAQPEPANANESAGDHGDSESGDVNGFEEEAKKAYWLCGGNIREMIEAIETDFRYINDNLQYRISLLTQDMQGLLLHSTARVEKESDRLRTMFRQDTSDHEQMYAVQVVDSEFVLHSLRLQIGVTSLVNMYNDLKDRKVRALQGCLFELVVHAVIEENCKLPARDERRIPIIRGIVDELSKPDFFWIPSKANFPNIDSALVHETTLYAFQMTIRPEHDFVEATFRESFLKDVVERCANVDNVIVYFLHPTNVAFRHEESGNCRSKRTVTSKVIVERKKFGVDMTSDASILRSLSDLFSEIRNP
jgi:hypothetical protein